MNLQKKLKALFMTVAAGTVSKKILYKGCNFVDGIIDNYEKVASSKKHTKFKTRVQKVYLIKAITHL